MSGPADLTIARPQGTPSIRLLVTLAGAGVLAGLLIVGAYTFTLPAIETNRAARLEAAILEVVPRAVASTPLFHYEGRLVSELPDAADPKKLERIYLATDAGGAIVGYAIPSAEPGFMDNIGLIFGYASDGQVLGMKVLESKETPGLGDKIEKDLRFVGSFQGVPAPLNAVRPGRGEGASDVDVITGATISSRTVVKAINSGIERWREPIAVWERGGGS
jgi:Na+-translocating ferredoxin:NAD+ oxidoreductase subunit G